MTPHLIRKCMPAARAGTLCFALCSAAFAEAGERGPLVIEDQGSLIAGVGCALSQGLSIPTTR